MRKLIKWAKSQGQVKRFLYKGWGVTYWKWAAYWIPEVKIHLGPRCFFGTNLFDHGFGVSILVMKLYCSICLDGNFTSYSRHKVHTNIFKIPGKIFDQAFEYCWRDEYLGVKVWGFAMGGLVVFTGLYSSLKIVGLV